ncbi:MAG: glycosyltransferase [Bacteroidales bacterium]|nr:glycosyltransferase [Bacteroidales bacterium]
MKILLISTHFQKGGAAMSSSRLLKALKGHGVDVKMLVQDGENIKERVYSTTGGNVKRWINLLRFIVERLVFLPRESSKSIRFLFSLANTGESIAKNPLAVEADVIHFHWINAGFISLRSLKELFSLGKPVVWTFHDMWAFTGGCHYALECENYKLECGNCTYLKNPGRRDLSHRIWKKKERLFRNSKFTVVTPSQWLHNCGKSSSLLGHCDFNTIRYSLDETIFKPVKREEACSSLGLDAGKKYILFGAATVKNIIKGFQYFRKAIEILYGELDGDSGVEIILFGKSGGDEASMFPLKTRSISFVSSTETLVELYSIAHLFVIPSLQDNSPNTIMESMLCGTPVVGFNSGGIPEMIDHLENGYVAEHKSATDLAMGMKWVLQAGNYDSLSASALSRAVDRYQEKRAAEEHVELYERVFKENRE